MRPTAGATGAGVGALALDMATRAAAGLAGLALLAAPTHLLCGLLDGSSSYARLEYAFAAWYAPLLLIAGLPLLRGAGVGAASPLAIYGVLARRGERARGVCVRLGQGAGGDLALAGGRAAVAQAGDAVPAAVSDGA